MPRIIALDQLQQFVAINLLSDPGALGGPVVVPNCVQIVFNWNLSAGKTAHNVLYGRVSGIPAPTVAQAEAIRSALTTGAAWTALLPLLAASTSFSAVTLRSVHAAGQPMVQSTGGASTGTSAALALPNEVAVVATLRTAFTGPSNRGRMYLPGLAADSLLSGNVIAPGTVTALNNWVAGFTAIFAAQGYTWVIGQLARAAYTGITGTAHPARPAGSVPITSATVRNNTWDSQRRRGLK
jgi:hypothetical protein